VTFTKRHVDLEFQLGQGSFKGTDTNTLDVTGLRVSAAVSKAGGYTNSTLDLRVWGLPLSVANDLSTLGKPLPAVRNNVVTVRPWTDDNPAKGVAFIGIIQQAWSEMQAVPENVFTIQATSGFFEKFRPLPPTSVDGPADVATLMSGLAKQMELNFENSGVQVTIPHPYLSGTGLQQAQQIMEAANINMIVDNSTLAIWPLDGTRNPQADPVLVSAETGLVGYPTWTANGLALKTLANVNIAFGGAVKVESDIEPANGVWSPFKVDHIFESEVPDGQWFTTCEAASFTRSPVAG
jgi:hypothetical protein